MRKTISFFLMFLLLFSLSFYFIPRYSKYHLPLPSVLQSSDKKKLQLEKLKSKASELQDFIAKNNFSSEYCFLIDMNLPSGRNRFFIYDLQKNTIAAQGLVAHGSCNTNYAKEARFSNVPGCGCSSIGRYKIGYSYRGRFGKAYKLYGLDSTNNNAFKRNVVLHAYDCITDKEVYPQPVCNSLGCPMVSHRFFQIAEGYIEKSEKPILLWIF